MIVRLFAAAALLAIGMVLTALAARAETVVPPECVELAVREGFPTDVLSDRQVRSAKVRLAWLRVRHPGDCAHRRGERLFWRNGNRRTLCRLGCYE